jgi:hypothetical protein
MAQLSDFADRALQSKGLYDALYDDLVRLRNVAPILENDIKRQSSAKATPWSAEAALDILRSLGFRDLSFQESHLGNCATIRGLKPPCS